ncbi:MAG: tRNA 2-thiocytidine biosynthesis protein TtcA [Clostridia bacterium]|nr:tRNA 2-thiocytidine biosynthesis protein TtcA [Clostridia bacterium]
MEEEQKPKRKLERYQEIEKSIITTYRKTIWSRFIDAINEYQLIEDGDKIAVCISGGKDSMLMAKCFQELERHGKKNFECVYLCMNPGYNEINKQRIISNAKLMNIPLTFFESNIFDVVERIDSNPCYICARMRRGYLYTKAKELGCNKIALGHHFDDVIETILMGMLYGSQVQTMMPKLHSSFHKGMQLIRPMYYVNEADILAWKNKNDLQFIQCACRFTENCTMCDNGGGGSKREEVKNLIKKLRQTNPKVDINIFRSVQNVNLDTIISYKKGDEVHHFLDNYAERCKEIDAKIDEEMIANKEKKFKLELNKNEYKEVDNTTMQIIM